MHDQARKFTLYVKSKFPQFFDNYKFVLDVGSADINGNNMFLFSNCIYLANDVVGARNVTIVSETRNLPFSDASFDVIVSTECFEHDMYYQESIDKIIKLLKPGGLFFFTCATTGRPEHGTSRSSPYDSMTAFYNTEWANYYKNLTDDDINIRDSFETYCFYTNEESCDLYFWGVKKGGDSASVAVPDDYTVPSVVKGKSDT
jgi:SAM-dependent methyltransferase